MTVNAGRARTAALVPIHLAVLVAVLAAVFVLAPAGAAAAAPQVNGANSADAANGPATAANSTSDTHAAARLIEHGEREMRSDPEASRRDAQSALRMLERAPDPDLQVRAHLLLCDYESERDSGAAELEVTASLALLPKVTRAALRAGVMLCQGAILETAGDSGKALEHYRDAVALANRANDEDMLGEARYQLGYLLGARGDYANALAQLRQAQRLFEKLGKPLHRLAALNSIAILYDRIGEYAEARQIYEGALPTQAAEAMQRDQAVTLSNLGRADENLHDWKAAQEAYAKSLEISIQLGYARAQGYALRGMAAVANATGDPTGALTTLTQAEQLLAQTPDARLHALIELQRGIALHVLKRLKDSAASLEEAARIFAQADARPELADTLNAAAAVYADSGSWHAAYARQSRAKALAEELLRNQINVRFAALKVEFDTAAREKEVATLTRENQANARELAHDRRDRQMQLAVIGLMVLVALLAGVLALLQMRATRRLRVLAMTDELTRIPNRRAVLQRLDGLLSTSDLPTSILILDIDHFKSINDQHGHPAGDEVLKAIAQALQGALSAPAYFGRLGGEEFLIMLPATDLDTARTAAERLRELVAGTPLLRSAAERRLTVSIGVGISRPRGDTPSSLLRRADNALYAAKGGGRNCVMTEPADSGQMLAS